MSILRRRFLFLAVLGPVLAAAPLRAADTASAPPTVVVRLRSLESLIANVKYLASLSAKPDDAKQLDPIIAMVNALQGIDSKRPIGFYGIADPGGNPQDSKGVVLLPVTDEKSFLAALEKFNVKAAKGDDGIYTITAENLPIEVYLRFANGYAYVSALSKEPLQKDKLLPSSKVFPESYPELISLTFRIDQIPGNIRQIIIGNVEARISNVDDEKPKGETKEQHEYRVLAAKEFTKHFVTFLNEGAEMSLRFDIDRKAKHIALELSAAGKPGSTVAAHIKDLEKSQSLFAGLATTDAALTAIVHASFPEPARHLLGKVLDDAMRNVAKEKDATKRAHGEKILKALAPTLKSGELDAAVCLRGPGENKLYTLVAGLKVKEGTTLEDVIRELSKELPPDAKNVVKLDAEAEGDVKIHRFDIQHFFDADARKAFGDNPIYLALRSDALFLSAGESGLKAIKSAIAAGPAPAPPVSIDVALARFVPLMAAHGKADPAVAAKKAFGDAKGSGKLHLTVEGGNAFKVRLDLDAAAFQFFSLVGPK